jgi:hypothetical protein
MAQHARTPVVQDHNMNFFGALVISAALDSGEQRLVGGQLLARAGTRQEF